MPAAGRRHPITHVPAAPLLIARDVVEIASVSHDLSDPLCLLGRFGALVARGAPCGHCSAALRQSTPTSFLRSIGRRRHHQSPCAGIRLPTEVACSDSLE